MIFQSTEVRRSRPDLTESEDRRITTRRKSRFAHEILSKVGNRSDEREAPTTPEPTSGPFGQVRRDAKIETPAMEHGRTKATIRRVISEMRFRQVTELPIDFVPNRQFSDADADAIIMTEMPISDVAFKNPRVPSGLSAYLASLYEAPLLNREQEFHLFRKFNYLKYKASKLRTQLDTASPQRRLMVQIERFYEAAVAVKNQLVRANLRLVVSIAKRYVDPNGDLWELVSEGNMSLMRAIEKFDFARGNKLSTYASWAIMRNFARSIPTEQRHRSRFRTSHEDTFSASEEHRSDQYQQENAQRQREAQVQKIGGLKTQMQSRLGK